MQIIHALADAGEEGYERYAECTCGMRSWGDTDWEAWDAFQDHRELAMLHEMLM